MIPRDKVLIGLPCYDFKIDTECMEGLFHCLPYYGGRIIYGGCYEIALARSDIAHRFVEKYTSYDWLMFIDSDTGFSLDDWRYLWEGDEDIVIASYAKKFLGEPHNEFGLGFTRIHRRVFEQLKELKTEEGEEKLPRFFHKGEMKVHYFPSGAFNSRWTGEDTGFFMWAAYTDAKVRLEKRTKLKHFGRLAYQYPEQIPGYARIEKPEDGAQ
jgi:hypothetical protein